MNKIALSAALAALVATAQPVSAATIILESDIWCPYTCEPGSDKPGYMIEVAREVFAKHGHDVEYKVIPWARALEDVRKGEAHGAVGASATDARDLAMPGEALASSGNVYLVRAEDGWTYSGTESLAGRQIGTIKDYSYGEAFDAWAKVNDSQVQVLAGDSPLDQNLLKLKAGRIDTIVDDAFVVGYTVKQMGLESMMKVAGKDSPVDLNIAFTRAKPEGETYAKQLSDGISALRASGKLKEILGRYGLKDWK